MNLPLDLISQIISHEILVKYFQYFKESFQHIIHLIDHLLFSYEKENRSYIFRVLLEVNVK